MNSSETIRLTEIYQSIQGESSFVGQRCVFVRLTGCNLRCNYCDTEYSFYGGKNHSINDILNKVNDYNCNLIEITGGEPLLQKGVLPLMNIMCEEGKTVLIETSGNRDISVVDPRVHIIMDLKTPSSGESERNRYENIKFLKSKDEVKFVIGSEEDYIWSRDKLISENLNELCGNVIFSPVFEGVKYSDIVDWIIRDGIDVTFQLQLHKFIWDPAEKGV
ncbi:MAG: radical SAM protein [Verrucomicrobiales bacterium]|nr:MAG: radical SAM protein [Verrucomicrobiaceae bacterium]|tara:strand:+ start:136 stop:792 length:657 start_codon:yes stop_codon:yes gene_type:complete